MLIADITLEIVRHEQVSICVRIIHRNDSITEHLLACKKASGTTAENLYHSITTTLKSKNISFHKLIAQTYDGASNMSGCFNCLQALIQTRINTNIVYIHCYAHALNLVSWIAVIYSDQAVLSNSFSYFVRYLLELGHLAAILRE